MLEAGAILLAKPEICGMSFSSPDSNALRRLPGERWVSENETGWRRFAGWGAGGNFLFESAATH
jgi:hypothetical protein